MGKGGTGTLSVNGKKVAEGRIEKTVPVVFSTDDTFDVGEDWGTPSGACLSSSCHSWASWSTSSPAAAA